jgi:L-amino acid N-acyltransferase YncA
VAADRSGPQRGRLGAARHEIAAFRSRTLGAVPKPKPEADPTALRRESAGRYVSGDGRFAVVQESAGSWVLEDSGQTNELGLPLVRGPFPTLADAKAAASAAREGPTPASPLAGRIRSAGRSNERSKPEPKARPARRGVRQPDVEPKARASKPSPLDARPAAAADADAIARIYNEGIASREATFETRPRSRADVLAWLDGRHPVVVVARGDAVVAFAATSVYSDRDVYRGVAECSVYADAHHRREGAGRSAMDALIAAAADAGFWKLVSRVFPENRASRGLLAKVGFREVGTYRRHARLDGEWRDVVIVERLLGDAREA